MCFCFVYMQDKKMHMDSNLHNINIQPLGYGLNLQPR
jgi:hypothetical protein